MDYYEGLNEEQKKAVDHDNGPMLIVAGAGTGKTTVITRRIARLIAEKKCDPDGILALTFTDKAAHEMEERIDRLLPYGYVDLWVLTFHAFGERLLRTHGLDIGLADFIVLTETEQWRLMYENFDTFELKYYRPLGNPTKCIQSLIHHFSKCKDEDIAPENYLEYAESLSDEGADHDETQRIREVANAYHTYQRILLQNNALDFGDLIRYSLKLFRERPRILRYYQEKFQYIMVDEFQDTNWAQYELIQRLTALRKNIVVVGDDDQSIYKFRGASVSNILNFQKDYHGAAQVVLTRNYRSSQEILDIAYDFIQQNNPNRLESAMKIEKRLSSQCGRGGVVEHLSFPKEYDEAMGVVQKILDIQKRNKSSWSDFAILMRANSSAESFLEVLQSLGVPHQYLASSGLFAKPIILDIIAFLGVLVHHFDAVSLYRLLSLSYLNISHDDIVAMIQYSNRKNVTLFDILAAPFVAQVSEDAKNSLPILREKIKNFQSRMRSKSASAIIYDFVHEFGTIKHLDTLPERETEEQVGYLNQFLRFVKGFEVRSRDKSVKAFMNAFRFYGFAGDEGSLSQDVDLGPDTVKVMTIHASKGLEFEHVFLVHMVDRRFPSGERKDPIEIPAPLIKDTLTGGDYHLEEERRLFYVGVTRAKRGLYLSSALDYGGKRKKKPSRFLYEANLVSSAQPSESHELVIEEAPAIESVTIPLKQDVPMKPLSFTQIKAFQTCPWQYRYAFVIKIPVRGKASLSFGKSMHNTLQKFFQSQRVGEKQASLFDQGETTPHVPNLETLLSMYESSWMDDWYESADQMAEYKKKGSDILKKFYALHENNWPTVLHVEKGFRLKIGKYVVRGKIDRIDLLQNGSIEIIDYKTGVPKNEKEVDKNQLLIYLMAAQQLFQEQVSRLTYFYLESLQAVTFEAKQAEIAKLESLILETVEAIQKGEFQPKPNAIHCRNCDFKNICEFRKLS